MAKSGARQQLALPRHFEEPVVELGKVDERVPARSAVQEADSAEQQVYTAGRNELWVPPVHAGGLVRVGLHAALRNGRDRYLYEAREPQGAFRRLVAAPGASAPQRMSLPNRRQVTARRQTSATPTARSARSSAVRRARHAVARARTA